MARSWLIDSRRLAKKVKNAGVPAACQIEDCGANLQCPNCQHVIDNSDASHEWPGLPKGVKFDPTDAELLEHLAAKCGVGGLEPHKFIEEFIPTLEGDEGICVAHPENLPGAKKDGSNFHVFYRIAKAYASGHRKRRRIEGHESNMVNSHVRWHKTGKTKPVMENGVHKGFKKIMVLYGMSKKGLKQDKCNWVMHQYHLGSDEEEKEGEYVVSKIFYQREKANDRGEISSLVIEESDVGTVHVVPRTPKTYTPDPHGAEKTPMSDYGSDGYLIDGLLQEAEDLKESSNPSSVIKSEDEMKYASGLAGDPNAVDISGVDSLLCHEAVPGFCDMPSDIDNATLTQIGNIGDVRERSSNFGELDNLEMDSPPDFLLSDLQFASQDSFFDFYDGR